MDVEIYDKTLEDVEESNVKLPEKPMSWEDMITIAMQFVVEDFL